MLEMGGRRAAFALILAAGGAPPAAPQVSPDQVIERVLRASVQIVVEHAGDRFRSGSGVVIAGRAGVQRTDCVILTTAHTVSSLPTEAQVLVLFDRDRGPGVSARADVLAREEIGALDLALLRAEFPQCVPTQIGRIPRLGDPVWTVGFPWGRGLRLTGGVVSQVLVDGLATKGPAIRLMIDASVASGASGGGVFDARTGQLLGLVEGLGTARVALRDPQATQYIDVPMPGETYVIAASTIRQFLRTAGYGDLLEFRAVR
jgi:S1-C subfamily serine protease